MALPEGVWPVMWWVRSGRLVDSWVSFVGREGDDVDSLLRGLWTNIAHG